MRNLKVIIFNILFLSFSLTAFAERYSEYEMKQIRESQARIALQKIEDEKIRQQFRDQKHLELKIYRDQTRAALEQIKIQDIKGIEVLIAGSDNTQAMSMLGHAAIRLVMGNDPLEDIIVGPEAFIDDEKVDYNKGITGGYTVIPKIMTFMDFLIQYHRSQFRTVTRIIIPSSPESRKLLIEGVLVLNDNPTFYGKEGYKFMTNNCASIVMKLLTYAGLFHRSSGAETETKESYFEMQDIAWLSLVPLLRPYTTIFALASDTPQQMVTLMREFSVTTIPESYLPAIDIFFSEMKSLGSYFLSKDPKKWKKSDIDNLKKLSTQALYMLYVGPLELPAQINNYVKILLQKRDLDLYEIYKMTVYDQALYNICKDSVCAKKQFQIIKKNWTHQQIISTAARWGVAPNRRYDVSKYHSFNVSLEYNEFMQSLFEAQL